MVGGAHGQVGRRVQQLVAVVKEQDNVYATILSPQGVEGIVSVAAASKGVVPLQVVQVRPLNDFNKVFELSLKDNATFCIMICSSLLRHINSPTTYPDILHCLKIYKL